MDDAARRAELARERLDLVSERREPFRNGQDFGYERDATHRLGALRRQTRAVEDEAIDVLAGLDRHLDDTRAAREEALALALDRDAPGERPRHPRGKRLHEGAEIALRLAHPSGVEVEGIGPVAQRALPAIERPPLATTMLR